jgi:hypothetical protein
MRRGSPQDRADSRHQFGGIEWLWQIIVRAHLKAPNAVVRIAARRQHKHRRARTLPDAAQHLEAVHVRHHYVEHDQRVIFREGPFDADRSVWSPACGESLAGEEARHELAEPGVIVDNQHAFHGKSKRLHFKTRGPVAPSRSVKSLSLTVLDKAWHF